MSEVPRSTFKPTPIQPTQSQVEELDALLNSNLPARTSSSFSLFFEAARVGDAELERCEGEIAALELQLSKLRIYRARLAPFVAKCNSLSKNHIRTLPNELLVHIVKFFAQLHPAMYSSEDPHSQPRELARLTKSHLLRLGQVCSRWRQIVLDTPSLWSCISINTQWWPLHYTSAQTWLSHLGISLQRSANHPLDLRIYLTPNLGCQWVNAQVMLLLAQHSNRWTEVSLTHTAVGRLLTLVKLNGLQQLRIVDRSPRGLALPDISLSAPLVSSFFYTGNAQTIPSLAWGQLKRIEWTTVNPSRQTNDFILGLEPFTRLPPKASMVLRGFVGLVAPRWTEGFRITSHIGVLDCRVRIPADETRPLFTNVNVVLDRLTLPRLNQFLLYATPNAVHLPIWSLYTFSALAARSNFGDTLTLLSLLVVIPEVDLLEVLRELPSLEDLVIADYPPTHTLITDTLLLALSVPALDKEIGDVIVPRLGLLDITTRLAFTDALLLDMVQGRVQMCRHQDELNYVFTLRMERLLVAERELDDETVRAFEVLDIAGQMGGPFEISPTSPTQADLEALDSLLRSNVAATSSPAFSRFVAAADSGDAELGRYDGRIEALERELDLLRLNRTRLALYVDKCKAISTCYIRALPNELLGRIAEIYTEQYPEMYILDDEDTATKELARLVKSHLLQLAQVCSRWRQVVLGTPSLWSQIMVNTHLWPPSASVERHPWLPYLETCLERAEGHPLTLDINPTPSSKMGKLNWQVVSLLVRQSNRWKDVFFAQSEANDALRAAYGRLDALEELQLADTMPSANGIEFPDLFASAPRLSSLTYFGNARVLPSLPWDQLMKVEWNSLAFEEEANDFILGLGPFGRLPRDASLILKGFVGRMLVSSPPSPMITSHIGLLSCRVKADSGLPLRADTNINEVLGRLTLPSLTEFKLFSTTLTARLPVWNNSTFSALAERSNFRDSLTLLTLLVLISEADLLNLLREVPKLEDLVIADFPMVNNHVLITDSLLSALSVPAPNTNATEDILVPRLGLLEITTCMAFSDATLRSFAESRVMQCRMQEDLKYEFTLSVHTLRAAERQLDEGTRELFTSLESQGRMGLFLEPAEEKQLHVELGLV
ncbi:hypothetical protein MKEN_00982600 [Mycena kentingensis (nom. inval.)]|nr:hypothetical protein MKEN_00982600 [Mycena kentingensis (nom. inval.)]